jgi:cytosine/adenosine deaminase-related metal-dependent hydrolase/ubiquinone/menaquinone biosynthesis C-methylase UbiE
MTSKANIPDGTCCESAQPVFAALSEVYDDGMNPMLSLEERFLSQILPELAGLDVVDVGCGTGRWLEQIAGQAPASLIGIDASPHMLDRARRKLGERATLLIGHATSLELANSSADVVLASFLVSYLPDLSAFAAEVRRVARGAAQVYVSDLHPDTVAACNWKRAFRVGSTRVEMTTRAHSLQQVISCFEDSGFEVAFLLEPSFGLPELEIFRKAGRLESFSSAAGCPAIYVLQLRIAERRTNVIRAGFDRRSNIDLIGARIALGPSESASAHVAIDNGRITSIADNNYRQAEGRTSSSYKLDLQGYLVFPGLINSHDHLEYALYPNLGHGPYRNYEEWADDIQENERSTIERQRSIPKDVRLWWGAIRNLLCGVTTVCHHNPLHPVFIGTDFPVHVLTNFGWAHSIAMDSDIPAKFQATPPNLPFIVHVAEGLDQRCTNEVLDLYKMGAMDGRTVLVHSLAVDNEGISLLNRCGASLVWCPTSNHFLFGCTHTRETLSAINKVLLGSDSPLTAAGDLLDEIGFAYSEIGIPADELYRMLFTRPRSVFRLQDGQGSIGPGATADLVAVPDRGRSPAETVATTATKDVELVVVAGRVHLASEGIAKRLPAELMSGLEPLEVEGLLRWVRAPIGRLLEEARHVLGSDITIGKKRVRHVCTASL